MATYTKQFLSAAPNGNSILVANAALPGVVVHIATTGTNIDEVYLYGYNAFGSSINMSVYWGDTNGTNSQTFAIPGAGAGRVLLLDGRIIKNGGTISALTTSAGTTGMTIDGFVNRIS